MNKIRIILSLLFVLVMVGVIVVLVMKAQTALQGTKNRQKKEEGESFVDRCENIMRKFAE